MHQAPRLDFLRDNRATNTEDRRSVNSRHCAGRKLAQLAMAPGKRVIEATMAQVEQRTCKNQ